jgi:hypothetical protein
LVGEDRDARVGREKSDPGEGVAAPWVASHEELGVFPVDITAPTKDAEREVDGGARPEEASGGPYEADFER